MKKHALGLTLLAACTLAGCSAGPHQLSRTVDDWDHEMYVDSPWLNGVLHFVPVIPICYVGAALGDFFVTDAYAFWLKDAWDGVGTGFKHFQVAAPDGAMSSLLNDDSGFLTIK